MQRADYEKPALTVFGSVQKLTKGTVSTLTNDSGGSKGGTPKGSDVRLKENIVRVGEHASGFGLYLFDYKPEHHKAFGDGRQFGVIAQEIEELFPQAVSIGADGMRRVNYGLLGITVS